MAALGRLPSVGDRVTVAGHLLEVLEVDGHRAARLRVEPVPETEPTPEPAA
jgi:CBS domain containing-hemolysin-like protein